MLSITPSEFSPLVTGSLYPLTTFMHFLHSSHPLSWAIVISSFFFEGFFPPLFNSLFNLYFRLILEHFFFPFPKYPAGSLSYIYQLLWNYVFPQILEICLLLACLRVVYERLLKLTRENTVNLSLSLSTLLAELQILAISCGSKHINKLLPEDCEQMQFLKTQCPCHI